jgi:hypothetical protein
MVAVAMQPFWLFRLRFANWISTALVSTEHTSLIPQWPTSQTANTPTSSIRVSQCSMPRCCHLLRRFSVHDIALLRILTHLPYMAGHLLATALLVPAAPLVVLILAVQFVRVQSLRPLVVGLPHREATLFLTAASPSPSPPFAIILAT